VEKKNLDLSEKNKFLLYSQKDLNESKSSQPFDEVKILQQKVEELTLDLAKFVNGTENLKRLIGTSRHPSEKSGLGYQNDEEHTFKFKLFSKCSIYSKYRHLGNRF